MRNFCFGQRHVHDQTDGLKLRDKSQNDYCIVGFYMNFQVDFFRRQKAVLTTDNYREQREKAEAKRSCSHGAINAYYAAKNVGLNKPQHSLT